MKPTPTQAEVRASLRGRLEDVIEELEAVRGVMRDELPYVRSVDANLYAVLVVLHGVKRHFA